jgi:hypothetical protein
VRHGKGGSRKYASGFSLFEMVVTICSIVILYMVAEERLNQLPAAAERANFQAVLEQIKTGVSFEMVTRLAAGRSGDIRNLEGENPMNFLIEEPSNYQGELDKVTDAVERRNAWYFETATGELVYVVGGASIKDVWVTIGGVPVNLGQIRFRLTNVYSEAPRGNGSSSGAGDGTPGRGGSQAGVWEALILAPVREYRWDRGPEQPVPLDQ